ncbi:hypothetical protein ALC57_11415 [Trachymyrmex cornetzi]|uniref:Uncharacterized protein n=1 Tax=Trachymyrmex cornetzi TaxID=471704 RepID=A0A151J2Q4_9HYME|nr:hypothetical protein ALC57_11415 [Trachymyrmex cornetzi]
MKLGSTTSLLKRKNNQNSGLRRVLKTEIEKKRPHLKKKKVLFHQDNKYNVPFLDTDTPHIVLKELLRSIGFTVYYCNTQNVNIDSLCDTLPFIIMSDFSFMYDMPSDRAKNFKKEFIGEYVKMTKGKYTHNDKSLTMDTYKVLIVNARKT